MERTDERARSEAVVRKFGRVLLPLITAFKGNLSVDYALTREVARFTVEHKLCDSVIVGGTTGEFYALSLDERARLLEEVKKEVDDSVPLIAGTGSAFTNEAVDLTKIAQEVGYDAAMVVVPYYSHPEQDGIYEHFRTVAASTRLPVMIYNIPLFAGVNITPQTVGRLSEIENIVAIKDEAGLNPLQATAFINESRWRLAVYSGDDTMILQVLTQGGVGVVSGGAHVVGDIIKTMIEEFLAGHIEKATTLYHCLMEVFAAFHGKDGRRTNPTPLVKAAFEMTSGLPTSTPRPPLTPATDDERALLRRALRNLGKLQA